MQAVVLAGGRGSRLEPLTTCVPKPVLPLAGRPFCHFMLDWLRLHSVDDVLFCCGFLANEVEAVLGDEYAGMRLRYLREPAPLGTGGPLRLASEAWLLDERFLVLNGDVLTDIDLTAELAWHEAKEAAATLALVAVDDTSSYGVVPTHPDGQVTAFLEKSDVPVPTNRVNAGAYVLERGVVDAIPSGRAVSIEREVFPALVGEGLNGFMADGYWIDVGTPERYLEATYDVIEGRIAIARSDRLASSLLDSHCRLGGAQVVPPSVIGEGCSLGAGSKIDRSVLHDSVVIGRDCVVERSVLGAGAVVGEAARIGEGTLVGAEARIAPRARLDASSRVEPRASVA